MTTQADDPLAALIVPASGFLTAEDAELALTGAVSARIGGSNSRRAVIRVVIGGAAGLALTYGIGHLFGTAVS